MNTPPSNQTPLPEPASNPLPVVPAKRSWLPCGCWSWGFLGFLLFILAGLSWPCFGCVQVRGSQTKALAQAKQIGLALKLFAGDNDGKYPRQGVPVEAKDAPINSNQAFAALFPTYTQSERIFGNKLSAYQIGTGPDDIVDNPYVWKPVKTLQPGENVYGYVMGLTDNSNPASPLVVDGSDGTGHYNQDTHRRGGVWRGTKAVVIRLDNSGGLENLVGPGDARYIPRPEDHSKNLLEVDYLGKDVRYLDPAVARAAR